MSVPYPPTRVSAVPKPHVFQAAETRDFRTEARARFYHPGQARTQPYKPPVTLIQAGPFEGIPTSKADFTGEPAPPSVQYRPPVSEPGGVDTRDFSTEARQSYGYKGYQVRASLRPMEMPRLNLPFEANTSYRSEFRQFQSRPASSILPVTRPMANREDRDFRPESATFDFKGYQKRESLRPPETIIQTGPFEAVSTYKADFLHHKIPHVRPDVNEKVPVFGMETFPQAAHGQTSTQAQLARAYNANDQFYTVARHQQTYFTPEQRSARLDSSQSISTPLYQSQSLGQTVPVASRVQEAGGVAVAVP